MLKERVLQAMDLTKFKCAFMIKNLKTGECGSYNENAMVAAASLIKIPIMAEIFRQVKAGKLSLRQRIEVEDADKVPYSILTMLETGNDYSIHDLLTLMIVQSDNTAANLLIDIAGFDAVNDLMGSFNLKNTILRRKMMDLEAGKAGRENVTSAQDMARLLELLYRGEVIDEATSAYMIEIMKKQLDRSMMRLHIPDDTVIAHKNGELDRLSHEAGIVYHETGDYILAVFIWDAVNNNLARQSIGQIAKVVDDYFTEKCQ
jgi:beta-lactamase class A